MTDTTRLRDFLSAEPIRAFLVALTVTIFGVGALTFGQGHVSRDAGPLSFLLIVGMGICLFAARQWPAAVLIAVAVARIGVVADSLNSGAPSLAFVVALFLASRSGDRRERLILGVAVAAVSAIAVSILDPTPFIREIGGELALSLLPVAVADVVRTRDERLQDRIEQEAESRVQAERLRIARDLHDIVAHGLSTIAVQSGVASHLLNRDPSQADTALKAINVASKQSLEDLRAMVGVLRSTDAVDLQPAPTADTLTRLIADAEGNGCTVRFDREGTFPDDVAAPAVIATHRIVEEALTNVARHAGPVNVTVDVVHGGDAVDLRIENVAGSLNRPIVESTGVGIIGMTERATALGGHLNASPTPDGGFLVTATIPYHHES